MKRVLALFGLVAVGLAFALGGTAPFARLALGVGFPGIAVALGGDAAWRGVALFRAGRMSDAATAFSEAGQDASYNLGVAEAWQGRYAAALEAFDLAMAHRTDPAAEHNFDLIAAFYAGTAIEAGSVARWDRDRDSDVVVRAPIAQGDGRASGTGDSVTNSGAAVGLPALQSHEQHGARRVFDDRFIIADPRWLATLEDVPGAFLSARIAHEHKQRRATGQGQDPQETDW